MACPALLAWRSGAAPGAQIPDAFVTSTGIGPEAQLLMQAALQPHVDNAISKTTNVAADIAYEDFAAIYTRAFELGLKGCTVFRPNAITGAVCCAEIEWPEGRVAPASGFRPGARRTVAREPDTCRDDTARADARRILLAARRQLVVPAARAQPQRQSARVGIVFNTLALGAVGGERPREPLMREFLLGLRDSWSRRPDLSSSSDGPRKESSIASNRSSASSRSCRST
ncbi:MAG: hypothetical protein IPF73_13860 [Betaproteobacteria bacterium]|nr:hypothetical protein [Betaproteobacteria bacterium]